MKQSDIASLIIIVSISLVTSFFVTSSFISPDDRREASIEVVQTIDPNITEIDNSIFNANAVNPAESIQINEFDSDKPFSNEN